MATNQATRKQREPVTQLYDAACELLFAAQSLSSAASVRGATPAAAATLNCIDATLGALADAIGDMRRAAVLESSRGSARTAPALLERELGALEGAVRDARRVCDHARDRTAPVLAQLTLA